VIRGLCVLRLGSERQESCEGDDNVRARVMTQFGLYSETTPRNDVSPSRGQWNLADAYRYLSEAYGGYHFNVMHGINVDAGIFMSYVDFSATTSSTTGRISLLTFRRTRRGFSMVCACRFFPRNI
jgi:Putative beta-barrel porin-2, OmpL-like. bbp2